MQTTLKQTWDLDSIFHGGSGSEEFQAYLATIEQDVASLKQMTAPDQAKPEDIGYWSMLFDQVQQIGSRIRESAAFTSCLTAQNMKDKQATILTSRVQSINAGYIAVMTQVDALLTSVSEATWEAMLQDEQLGRIRFSLEERRRLAHEKLPPEQEALATALSVDGYHAWQELYNTVVGRMSIQGMSVGQAANKMGSADRSVRQQMFAEWENAWSQEADLCSSALNHLAGFRTKLYQQRGWDSIHKEPLQVNRMSEQTLHVMWDVIEKSKPYFVEFLQRKAKLLGLERLSWYDVSAPISKSEEKISYDEAASFIVENFHAFSPKMADFARMAFDKSWIEAENRPGKRPGGFCTSFTDSKQTRIFMTYAGSSSNVSTLAHELGHGYHQHVMRDLPQMAQRYAMNVAETASTFAEMIVSDAALKNAATEEQKLALLEDKISRSVSFFMNIHARFIFETNFYAERKKGLVSVEKLNELMVAAQKEAYHNALEEYHPHFWASKLHFYITGVPFYNFPYTFGYLFSYGIYAQALRESAVFEDRYIALLRDTASMTVEELAMRHLGVDLTQPDFWQAAVDLAVGDVQEFLKMSE